MGNTPPTAAKQNRPDDIEARMEAPVPGNVKHMIRTVISFEKQVQQEALHAKEQCSVETSLARDAEKSQTVKLAAAKDARDKALDAIQADLDAALASRDETCAITQHVVESASALSSQAMNTSRERLQQAKSLSQRSNTNNSSYRNADAPIPDEALMIDRATRYYTEQLEAKSKKSRENCRSKHALHQQKVALAESRQKAEHKKYDDAVAAIAKGVAAQKLHATKVCHSAQLIDKLSADVSPLKDVAQRTRTNAISTFSNTNNSADRNRNRNQ